MGSEKMKSTLKWNLVGTDKGHARKFLKKITIANNVFQCKIINLRECLKGCFNILLA